MIERFALLSVVMHAALAMLLVDHASPTPLLPAPVLTVAMSQAAVGNEQHPAPVRTMARPVAAPILDRAPSTATDSAQTMLTSDNNMAERGDQQRRNHLRAMLQAAFEAQFVYPPLARRHGWQGRVHLALRIEADGRLRELRVLRSSGYAVLDQDALQTLARVNQLRQSHAWLDDRPVDIELPVVYRLIES